MMPNIWQTIKKDTITINIYDNTKKVDHSEETKTITDEKQEYIDSSSSSDENSVGESFKEKLESARNWYDNNKDEIKSNGK